MMNGSPGFAAVVTPVPIAYVDVDMSSSLPIVRLEPGRIAFPVLVYYASFGAAWPQSPPRTEG
jgi:hypothetical protein